ncbi:hypothetical protein [Alteromonas sp. a30]|uniref:hypothetical protein n=1 Tax=Alteromonas sp. a30 TaxID=2730917 RepID=UPI002280F5B5|nr:hypothetical protein [Alteromonas sp. a30]MCY7293815.1 hypothetical protein [Alteromonas sp. a30]
MRSKSVVPVDVLDGVYVKVKGSEAGYFYAKKVMMLLGGSVSGVSVMSDHDYGKDWVGVVAVLPDL